MNTRVLFPLAPPYQISVGKVAGTSHFPKLKELRLATGMKYTQILPNGINTLRAKQSKCYKNTGSKTVPRSLGHKDQYHGGAPVDGPRGLDRDLLDGCLQLTCVCSF